jgi:hypothetical protein
LDLVHLVGDAQVVEVSGGVSPEKVKVTAAEAAVRVLKAKEATMDIDMKD